MLGYSKLGEVSESFLSSLLFLILLHLLVEGLKMKLEDVAHDNAESAARDSDGIGMTVGRTPVLWPNITAMQGGI